MGTGWEIDTRPILSAALTDGKRLCVPLCTGPGLMELRQIMALDQLAPGAYGLPEPPSDAPAVAVDAVDLAVLPCMGCNHLGHRLGRGRGLLRPLSLRLPQCRCVAVPGTADPGGDPPGASRHAHSLGADGAGTL